MKYKIPKWLSSINDNWLLAACWILNESPSIVEHKHNNRVINKYDMVKEYLNRNKKINTYFSVEYLAEIYCDSQMI